MYKRYQGNTGRVHRVEERSRQPAPEIRRPSAQNAPSPARRGTPARQPGLLDSLGKLLPGGQEPLETEDLILLLILYLMYRESGDSDLLVIMGGMFLL